MTAALASHDDEYPATISCTRHNRYPSLTRRANLAKIGSNVESRSL
jgi:hypothetical protein